MAENDRRDSESELFEKLPTQVREQPDPFLQMSTGKSMGGGALALAVLAIVLVLGVVLYGLNGSNVEPHTAVAANSTAPAAPATARKGEAPTRSAAVPAAPAAPSPTAQQKGPGGNP